MSNLQTQYALNGEREKLDGLLKDFKTVLRLGERIKALLSERNYLNAKEKLS